MKTGLLSLLLVIMLTVNAQQNTVCYVTSVSGLVQKANGHKIVVGDTILESELKFLSGTKSTLTLYSAAKGSIQWPGKQNGTTAFQDMLDVFRAKSTRVSLSSRGDCESTTLGDCLKIDSAINQCLLLIDSLELPEPLNNSIANNDIAATFFLQWKQNGKLINKKLNCCNNRICIKPDDLINDGIEYDESNGFIKLGVLKLSEKGKQVSELGTLKICCTNSGFITDYYTCLKRLMKDNSSKEVFERFYQELYIFYGRPDICSLKNIIHYTD